MWKTRSNLKQTVRQGNAESVILPTGSSPSGALAAPPLANYRREAQRPGSLVKLACFILLLYCCAKRLRQLEQSLIPDREQWTVTTGAVAPAIGRGRYSSDDCRFARTDDRRFSLSFTPDGSTGAARSTLFFNSTLTIPGTIRTANSPTVLTVVIAIHLFVY